MKNRRRQGTKAEIRAYKERIRHIATVVIVAVIVVVAATVSGFLIYSYLKPSNQTIDSNQLRAAIVDHLSITYPNQTFIQAATDILQKANYTVDYYAGGSVNVDFYRNLPTHGYSLIVLRVHSTFTNESATDKSVALFTNESYSAFKYRFPVDEQLVGRLGAVAYSKEQAENGILYFGIKPSFVEYSMNGKFNKTVIIMMGCDGLMYTPMAEAFIKKGAQVYVGWDGPVSASHTDQATTQLLRYLVTEKQTIEQAVIETRNKVGPDPTDNSTLVYYPT